MVLREALAARLSANASLRSKVSRSSANRNLKGKDHIRSRDVTVEIEKLQSVPILAQVDLNAVKALELDVARKLWYREVARLSADGALKSKDRMSSRDVVVDKEKFQSVPILASQKDVVRFMLHPQTLV